MDIVEEKQPASIDWARAAGLAVMIVVAVIMWSSPILYPIRMLVVFLHELSHAVAAIATGGRIVEIQLHPGEGGLCITQGGSRFATLSAGYIGSLVWGGIMLTAARHPKPAKAFAAFLGIVLVAVAAFYVRPVPSFGLIFAVIAGVAMLFLGYKAPAWASAAVLQFIGLLSMLYVIVDIKSDILDRPGLPSDAVLLANHTGIPSFIWGAAWLAIALALSAAFLRDACIPRARKKAARY